MAEKVDQDVRDKAVEAVVLAEMRDLIIGGKMDDHPIVQALARMKAAGRQQGLREAAEVALSHMTCGCEGKHGYCSADSQPKSIAAAITALIEGEGK